MSRADSAAGPEAAPAGGLAARLGPAAVAYAGLWWLLADGAAGSWIVGAPAVGLAVLAWHALGTRERSTLSLTALLRFAPYFLWQSLRGGASVARRTLAPRLQARPGLTEYRTCLPPGPARRFYASCVSVLPGTLVVDTQADRFVVHLLDTRDDASGELADLERRVGRLFAPPGGTGS
jgi:multicomponent Na+:H+ antiporter subunit E